MLATHLFLLAIKEHYMVAGDKNQVFCDNLWAVYTFQWCSQRVTPGAKNAVALLPCPLLWSPVPGTTLNLAYADLTPLDIFTF